MHACIIYDMWQYAFEDEKKRKKKKKKKKEKKDQIKKYNNA